MDFGRFLDKQAQIIDKRLDEVLTKLSLEVNNAGLELGKLFNEFINSNKDGKRIRGALVLLGYKLGGGKDESKILDAAVAFEIFQTAILGQDDIIDKSPLRRGKESLYKALGGDDRGVSRAICLSDIGFFISYRLLGSLNIEDSLKLKGINLFSQTLTQTVLGEMLDIETPYLQRDFLVEDGLKIGLLKTARYTISGPLMLGAILAGADVEVLKKLQVFGDSLGTAFQIQDDILGIFGDEKKTGKSASSDIKECKATILIAYAQKNGNEEQVNILDKFYGNQEVDEDGVEGVRKVFRETGSLNYAESEAGKYFDKAKKSSKGFEEELLYSLVEFLEKRVN